MKKIFGTLVVALLIVIITVACGGGSGSPTAPTVSSSILSGALKSSVGDLPIVGADVSILSGPQAGKSVQTNTNGDYEIAGVSSGEVKVRFFKEGFKTLEEVVTMPSPRRNTILSVVDPVAINELERPVPATVLQPGEGMVFQATALLTRSGILNFMVTSNRPNVRVDIYVFSDEASAKICKDIPEGSRGGGLFEKACVGGGWTTTVLTSSSIPSIRLALAPQGAVRWGVIKHTDPNRVPYTVSGKTVFLPD